MNQPYDRRPPHGQPHAQPQHPHHSQPHHSQPHYSQQYHSQYGAPPGGYPPPGYPPYGYPPRSNGMATASMVIGIIALVFTFIPFIGLISWLLAPLAIIFGIVGMSQPDLPRGQAIAGLVTGGLALLMCLAWATLLMSLPWR